MARMNILRICFVLAMALVLFQMTTAAPEPKNYRGILKHMSRFNINDYFLYYIVG